MKKKLLLFACMLLFSMGLFAQDVYLSSLQDNLHPDILKEMEAIQLKLADDQVRLRLETRADQIKATLHTDGTLVVEGSGDLSDFDYDEKVYTPWYSDRDQIKHVEIRSGITSIGSECFRDCKNLASVSIANTVKTIGFWAFRECPKLTSVEIPASVKDLSFVAFYNCLGLTRISVDSNNTAYSSDNGVLFNKTKTRLITYPNGRIGAYVIPNTVVSIDPFSFSICLGLTSVVIPGSVKTIDIAAFGLCLSLSSLSILNSVTGIGDQAFMACAGLTSISVFWNDPRTVTYGENIFNLVDNKSNIKLLIPEKSMKSVYQTLAPWKDFYLQATGISDIVNSSIAMYPNPAIDYVVFSGVKKNEIIRFYDMKGSLSLTFKLTEENERVSISHLMNGFYFVRIGEEKQVLKFLKK